MTFDGLNIEDNGDNNLVYIDQDSTFKKSRFIINGNNNIIKLSKTLSYTNFIINIKGNNKQVIIKQSNKNINGVKLTSIRGDNQVFSFGENFSCGGLEVQMNDGDESFTVGDNCLFSWGIKARTSDGHSIIDLDTRKAINIPKDIHIGDRVWVGEDVSFLKGARINTDSVVGSRAVVTKPFEQENAVIAGFPAKVVKENIMWDRRMPSEYNSTNVERKKMKIAVLTMAYNEQYNLDLWVNHYTQQVPNGELIIIDHGSENRVSEQFKEVSTLRLPRSAFDDRKRADFVSDMQNALLSEYDWVIYTDSDELIVSEAYDTLEESLANESEEVRAINSVGINMFQHLGKEDSFDTNVSLSKQRKYGVLEKSMFKPSISRSKIRWIPGFHTSNIPPSFGNGYYLFHLKYIDFDWQLFRTNVAKEITWSEEAVRRGWNRFQTINSDQLTKKFQNIANFINAGNLTEFDFENEKSLFLDYTVCDSKGNYRADAEIKPRVIEVPYELLAKLP